MDMDAALEYLRKAGSEGGLGNCIYSWSPEYHWRISLGRLASICPCALGVQMLLDLGDLVL